MSCISPNDKSAKLSLCLLAYPSHKESRNLTSHNNDTYFNFEVAMSLSREDCEDGNNLKKPFLYTGSWYKMGSKQSNMLNSSTQ